MRRTTAWMLARSALTVAGLLALYAVIPVPGQRESLWFTAVMAVAGLAALTYAFITLAQRAQRARSSPSETAIRLEALVAVLYAFIVFMSLVYLGLSSTAGEFDELHTRVDALYFTMSTIATVGFGDVHATGQVARVVVTLQICLDLVFVGLVARIILPTLARQRAERNRELPSSWVSPDDDPMEPPPPS
jgi:voltage-gated potassium channel